MQLVKYICKFQRNRHSLEPGEKGKTKERKGTKKKKKEREEY